jgi:hypothetical protein
VLLAPPARADAAAAAAVPPAPYPSAPGPIITTEQLAYFSELVGEPRPVVWQRLQRDPGLVPFAVAAADERMNRKSSGKLRTAVGFTIFGVGGITGYIVMLSSLTLGCNYGESSYNNSCDDGMGRRFLLGALLMAASAGVGLGIGIPGIVSMARQSEAETAAVDRYQYPQIPQPPPGYGPAYSAAPGGFALKVPLLSLSF